jgi:hypothetical protein
MIKVTYISHDPESGAVSCSDTIDADKARIDEDGALHLVKSNDLVAGYSVGWTKWEKVDAPAAG